MKMTFGNIVSAFVSVALAVTLFFISELYSDIREGRQERHENAKAIAAMQVEQRYSDQERADTKAWRERIENKIDAIEAKLTGGD
jgi:septal ring factor EnvC (AmiA/AmiB activator)